MMSRTRQTLACILMVVGVAVFGHAQSTSKEPTAKISGKVTFQGEGVKGVIVSLRLNEPRSYGKLTNYRGVTDAKGEYRIANVPSGNYFVSPTATAFVVEGESNRERTLVVYEGETVENLDFSLIRGGVITGRVVDSDGRPVIEEEIHLSSPRESYYGSPPPAAITDDRGIYRIFGVRPGKYTVSAGTYQIGASSSGPPRGAVYSRTYYPGTTDPAQATVFQVNDGSEATNVDITFARTLTTHTASGRVVNGETGQPVPDVGYGVIRYFSPTQISSAYQGSVTNSRGEFKLENLPPGQYAVSIAPRADRDLRAPELRFEIVDQDVTGLVIRTVKGASLSGVVVLEGTFDKTISEQLRNATVVVFVANENTRHGILGVPTDLRPDGSFRIGGLPAGSATFSLGASQRFRIIRIERDGVIQPGGIEVKQGEDITTIRIVLGYADAAIRGIVEVENGTIPPNGQIFLRARKMNDNTWIDSAPLIDTRGQFVIDNLFPGTYELTSGVFVQGSRAPLGHTKQQVVVTAASTTNTTIKLDLNLPQLKP